MRIFLDSLFHPPVSDPTPTTLMPPPTCPRGISQLHALLGELGSHSTHVRHIIRFALAAAGHFFHSSNHSPLIRFRVPLPSFLDLFTISSASIHVSLRILSGVLGGVCLFSFFRVTQFPPSPHELLPLGVLVAPRFWNS